MKGIVKSSGKVINIVKTQELMGSEGKKMMYITSDNYCYGVDEVDIFYDDFAYWRNFRCSIASKMLPVTSEWKLTKGDASISIPKEAAAKLAIEYADELIKQLQETQFDALHYK